ncbi:type II toxin-antitoxin system HicA family toxin (plasmid) [Shewanella sp. SNU WT4]|uniref:type II toxin-antitoxin system HicA family toxin n=1 Tax=Shewanella sp. SNU WT4 TaxID=2590015 RepID=UPI00112780B0|nr:type II toxin-antitoxin system HicA family toxin [Shewanella sp. SNU WT4]QDF68680.1 type II toxin-antitoxin system HicA family toxin [Shewanella sp. SNU WT4]
MTKTDKLLAKLKSSKTLTWHELAGALKMLGYQQVEGDGSRVKFDNGIPKELINLHKPHPRNELKAYALRQVRDKLTEWGKL